jgi:hypothetical protein
MEEMRRRDVLGGRGGNRKGKFKIRNTIKQYEPSINN